MRKRNYFYYARKAQAVLSLCFENSLYSSIGRLDKLSAYPPVIIYVGAMLNSLFIVIKAELLVELINTSAGVDQLLLARVEGMAL